MSGLDKIALNPLVICAKQRSPYVFQFYHYVNLRSVIRQLGFYVASQEIAAGRGGL
jgi:hypothetical protein